MAEDLTQEVMLLLYREAGTLRNPERFRPWLYQIARNVLLQHLRRQGRQIEVIDLEALVSERPACAADPAWRSDFERWMAALDLEEQRIVTLRFIEGLEHHEIADLTGLPMGTVQWKVFQVKKKLAARFGPGIEVL